MGDNVVIENVQNYIANYDIGDDCFIQNVDVIMVDGVSTFGNGVEVNVLNETGGVKYISMINYQLILPISILFIAIDQS